ncbi:hypothetical protein CJ030_MR7G027515 [Morella rubra]|uniref:Uncharacterized protein n=1 Tax=Morella rubra TaxID=262757 RepID=A0A6A1V138_9ROSI|nr:hypothetical protein CJ030_MR7G027515 [Morella rubra]
MTPEDGQRKVNSSLRLPKSSRRGADNRLNVAGEGCQNEDIVEGMLDRAPKSPQKAQEKMPEGRWSDVRQGVGRPKRKCQKVTRQGTGRPKRRCQKVTRVMPDRVSKGWREDVERGAKRLDRRCWKVVGLAAKRP